MTKQQFTDRMMANKPMKAAQLKFMHGSSLIGRTVMTVPYGQWPGGKATVIEITPDPGAPSIVLQVRHQSAIDKETGKPWEIGVFEWEQIQLL